MFGKKTFTKCKMNTKYVATISGSKLINDCAHHNRSLPHNVVEQSHQLLLEHEKFCLRPAATPRCLELRVQQELQQHTQLLAVPTELLRHVDDLRGEGRAADAAHLQDGDQPGARLPCLGEANGGPLGIQAASKWQLT